MRICGDDRKGIAIAMKIKSRMISRVIGVITLSALLAGCGSGRPGNDVSSEESVKETAKEEQGSVKAVQGTDLGDLEEAAAQTASGESIVTNGGEIISLTSLEHQDENSDSVVYYISDISAQAMLDIYGALGMELTGDNIAVKLSTGAPSAFPWKGERG